jgi:hypothetical protein
MSRQHCVLISTLLLAMAGSCVAQSSMVPWLTRSADNSRSGWNQHETQLTQAAVLFNKFNPPVIDGGQIYVPNYNGGVDLYRLVQ